MENLASVEATPSTPPLSTSLDPDAPTLPSGAGAPRTLGEEAPSLRDTVALAIRDADAGEAKEVLKEEKPADGTAKPEAEKADKAEKAEGEADKKEPQPRENGKFAAKPKADAEPVETAEAKAEVKPAEPDKPEHGQRRAEPPARFLPDSKEVWRNVPRPVQRDIENMAREHEAEITRYREAGERYEALRQFDDLARSNGRDLRESLAKVTQIETLLQRNPLQGIQALLIEAGPKKADGTPLSLMEVAQFIVGQGPEGYQRIMQQQAPQPQQRQSDPEVAQLRQQLANMQQQQVTATVIEPFRAAHPRYAELEADIAFFLQSGRIPDSLSLHDKLAAAYDMAERINPSSDVEPASKADPAPDGRVDDFNGTKSIKSAPGSVSPDYEPERAGSIEDTVRDQLRRFSRARA